MRTSTEALADLAGRSRCPACGSEPLSIGEDALVCSACERRWPILSRRPLAVRLATDGVAAGEPFRGPPVARSDLRRAVWQWHARREERFASHIPALPGYQAVHRNAEFFGEEGEIVSVPESELRLVKRGNQ